MGIVSNPEVVYPGNITALAMGILQCTAPEMLKPESSGLEHTNPTEKSDIYVFGMAMYEVSTTGRISTIVINSSVQVTQFQPFPQECVSTIIGNAVSGVRPTRPAGTNKWLSNDVWDIISQCWYPEWDAWPNVSTVITILNDSANLVKGKLEGALPKLMIAGKMKAHAKSLFLQYFFCVSPFEIYDISVETQAGFALQEKQRDV